MSTIPFNHIMAAHCESGTVTALLKHHGLNITEPMVFGISSGLFFGYMKTPMLTFPLIFMRSRPGQVRSKFAQRTGVVFKTQKFRDTVEAEKALDRMLEQNQPVAVQVDLFYMDYFPAWVRIHINLHFITIIGKEGNKYKVSDSYWPEIVEIDREALLKGRFAGGNMAPKGFMFYPTFIPKEIDYPKVVIQGIKSTIYNMLKIPLPFLGVKGIRRFADKITDWPKYARDEDQLAHETFRINILLEDQGTGGGGFRFIYATFLRQASEILNKPELREFSKKMMEIGDGWREVSLAAAHIAKNRDFSIAKYKELGDLIRGRADAEFQFFNELKKEMSMGK